MENAKKEQTFQISDRHKFMLGGYCGSGFGLLFYCSKTLAQDFFQYEMKFSHIPYNQKPKLRSYGSFKYLKIGFLGFLLYSAGLMYLLNSINIFSYMRKKVLRQILSLEEAETVITSINQQLQDNLLDWGLSSKLINEVEAQMRENERVRKQSQLEQQISDQMQRQHL